MASFSRDLQVSSARQIAKVGRAAARLEGSHAWRQRRFEAGDPADRVTGLGGSCGTPLVDSIQSIRCLGADGRCRGLPDLAVAPPMPDAGQGSIDTWSRSAIRTLPFSGFAPVTDRHLECQLAIRVDDLRPAISEGRPRPAARRRRTDRARPAGDDAGNVLGDDVGDDVGDVPGPVPPPARRLAPTRPRTTAAASPTGARTFRRVDTDRGIAGLAHRPPTDHADRRSAGGPIEGRRLRRDEELHRGESTGEGLEDRVPHVFGHFNSSGCRRSDSIERVDSDLTPDAVRPRISPISSSVRSRS